MLRRIVTVALALAAAGCGTASRYQSFAELTEQAPAGSATLLVCEARLEVDSNYGHYFRPRGMVFTDREGKEWTLDRSVNLEETDPETWWASAVLPPGEYRLTAVRGRSGSIGCLFPVNNGPQIRLKAGAPAYVGRVVVTSEVIDGEPPCWDRSLPMPAVRTEHPRDSELAVWSALSGRFPESSWAGPMRARIAELEAMPPGEA